MRFDYGYAEEDRLGKAYDLRLLKRLLPFLRPYRRLLLLSVGLVICITLVELALPYFTKIVIDRYIVPQQATEGATGETEQPHRPLIVDLRTPHMREVVERYPDLFRIDGHAAAIAFEDLDRLTRADRITLRRSDLAGLTVIVLLFLGVVAADFILTFLQRMIMEYAGHKVMHDLRTRLFDHVQRQSMDFFAHQPVARLVTRTTNDVQNMHELFTTFIAMVFKDFFLLAGIAIVLIMLDWRMALAGLGVLPVVIWAAIKFSTLARDVFRALRVKVAEINGRMAETIEGVSTIQAFGREQVNYDHFAGLNAENYRLGMRQIHIFAIFMPIVEVLGITATAVLIFYGGLHTLSATISLGALVAGVSYLRMFFRPIRDLAENYNLLQNAMASAERIFNLFDLDQRLPQLPAVRTFKSAASLVLHDLVLDKVSFAYAPGETVLNNVSLRIRQGQTIAVVGPTGAGKSTLLNLIMRFYDPLSGQVLINGTDLRNWPLDALRSMLALVPQDPVLFTGSLRQNIFPAQVAVDPERVASVLEAANCRELVARLPQGLDTHLVKGGGNLSSGERQLVAIARALARDPQLILLDEATSYIDSQTEAAIHLALQNLLNGRTSVMVAHRLSTARMADRIIVMHNARVSESGSHDELMARQGLYARLTRQQTTAGAPQPNT
jgi:ATP-binding cassette, subfamily B, multidrug efflux pump